MPIPAGIDNLKATITRRGGVARGNRFAIYMTHPNTTMNSLLNLDKNQAIDLNNWNERMGEIGRHDSRDMYMLCESVQLPGKRIVAMAQPVTHFTADKPYSMLVDDITFTFLLTNDYHVRRYFDLWQHMIIDSKELSAGSTFETQYKKHYCKDVIIQQLSANEDDAPVYTVLLQDAWPRAIGPIDLSNTSENSLLNMTVTMAYTTWFDLSDAEVGSEVRNKIKELVRATRK